jgi:hypothetical protein
MKKKIGKGKNESSFLAVSYKKGKKRKEHLTKTTKCKTKGAK